MKHFRILSALFGCLLAAGCVSDPYEDFDVDAVNPETGISAGTKDSCIILRRGEKRQIISVSSSADEIRLMNCPDAPVLYVKVHFISSKYCSILKIELPSKERELAGYHFREIGTNAKFQGSKAGILDVKEVSRNGESLRVAFEVVGTGERNTGTFHPDTQEISVP